MSSTNIVTPKSAKSTKAPRKSPIAAAVFAAERAVLRTERRKARSLARVDRLKARIATTISNAAQFDQLIAQLHTNVSALKAMMKAGA